ncbi:hypothetical protein CB0940_10869 [Cercospora beticola]|uniref:BTB domain-containing protein n=1 Tax=Cercospora beticola TaxID=122368 RepID=A0A2G5HV09_CERBT|nr:hypothetical protein CB0940_10869 [Cercospora beticola]PIA96380.1 hypothetical protein CB0940_10869 [Cercospora beticola]WPB07605.1 hypothetical protein RHO25_012266 [Cercospora beticola]
MAANSTPGITDAVKSLFGDDRYTDLTILCSEHKWRVHKAIVCTRCEFFAKAVDDGFQEAGAGVIDLPNDHPNAIAAMLRFLYTDEYDDAAHLLSVASEKEEHEWTILPMHIRVYQMAHKYELPKLADLAQEELEVCLKHEDEAQGLYKAIKILWEQNGEAWQPLRACVMEHFLRRTDLLVDKDRSFQHYLESHPSVAASFSRSLVVMLGTSGPLQKVYKCPKDDCGVKFIVKWRDQDTEMGCAGCGQRYSKATWKRFETLMRVEFV